MFFQKHRLKIASLRIEKHRIVKKSEHRPPLVLSGNKFQGHVQSNSFTAKNPFGIPLLGDAKILLKIFITTLFKNCEVCNVV